jgi:ADP-ribose pyrophosphatase
MKIDRPQSNQPLPANAQKVFSGQIFDVYQWEQELYDGSKKTFEKIKRSDTVIIFPVLDDGRILLTKQEQPGKTPFIGAAGGKVEGGEDVLEAAKRELLEETGYEAKELILWDAQHPATKIDWVVYTFIAKGLTKTSEQTLDGGEKIELQPTTFDQLLEIAGTKEFSEKEVVVQLMEARISPDKRRELELLFKPL